MREWSLGANDPVTLCLSADARLCVPDYTDDSTWELVFSGGDPPAMALQTSYGLRATSMRIYAGFGLGGREVVDPERFARAPRIRRLYPNCMKVEFLPLQDLEVLAEFWAPDSHSVAGRYTIRNLGVQRQRCRLRLYAVLHPGDGGHSMKEEALSGCNVLVGRTGGIEPVLFLATGASCEPLPHPALTVQHELEGGGSKSITWVLASYRRKEDSFRATRALMSRAWDAEMARIHLVNSSMVDVETGNPDWDIAFAMAQKVALGCYMGPTRHLPCPSFVLSRTPDKGYSERGDGRDHGLLWDGQTAADACGHLALVIPAAPELAKGVIRNFLAAQAGDGSVDWKPGLAGQRNGALCQPLLATMSWMIYYHTEDLAFAEEALPRLVEFVDRWFGADHDRDEDGHPEWDHTLHAGYDEWPSFVRWQGWGQGLDVSTAETPDLASYLYRECQSLIHLARAANRLEVIPKLEHRMQILRESVESSWSDQDSSYHHRDRDGHVSYRSEILAHGRGPFTLDVGRGFDPPARILVRMHGPRDISQGAQVFLHGKGRRGRGRVERLAERDIRWFWGHATATSSKPYIELERVEVRGLSEAFETEILVPDYTRQDQTLLLPLWAGIPSRHRARRLVRETVCDPQRYWRPCGVPNTSAQDPSYAPDNRNGSGGIWMLWNVMLAEGLIDYGFAEEATELLGRLMQSIVGSLRKDHAFHQAYHADRPEGLGERNHLAGLAPLGLFLKLTGVTLISPRKIGLRGRSPFSWPVTIRWRGLEVTRLEKHTVVVFPDGGRIELDGEEARLVEQADT